VHRFPVGCLLFVMVFGSGCPSHTLLSVKDQENIKKKHGQKTYYLKQSFFVGPFFAYDDRHYISERAFDERILIQSPGGDPILPCEPTGVLSMGTRVTVRGIEFPTSGAMASRKLKSPRHFTWVLLDVEGQPAEKPYVLVLTQEFKKIAEFESSLGDFLLSEDPRLEFSGYAAEELDAIDKKSVVKGMHADALLRSRGHPDRITREFVEGVRTERWLYTPDRVVVLKEGRVDSWQGFPNIQLNEEEKPDPDSGS
jgi:hypothetical protein